jgi:hypothetical protein
MELPQMVDDFRVIASVTDAKATAKLWAVKRFPTQRVDPRHLDNVGHVAAGEAIETKVSRFIAPIIRCECLCFDVCETLQDAVKVAFIHHIGRVQVIEIGGDLTVTYHFIVLNRSDEHDSRRSQGATRRGVRYLSLSSSKTTI